MGRDEDNDESQRADLRDEFLSVVSHELRTPLTSILGFTEMTRRRLERDLIPRLPKDDPKLDKAVARLRENLRVTVFEGRRLTDLVDTVLDLHKMRSGRMVWQQDPIDLRDVVQFCAASCSVLLMDKPEVRIDLRVPDDVAPVVGDRDRLLQACTHLLSNAVRATSEGRISLTLETDHDAGLHVVEVCDTGCGIPAEELVDVFEMFHKVADASQSGGTGLGLAITREIVRAHSGTIEVKSTEGVGTTFIVHLPHRTG